MYPAALAHSQLTHRQSLVSPGANQRRRAGGQLPRARGDHRTVMPRAGPGYGHAGEADELGLPRFYRRAPDARRRMGGRAPEVVTGTPDPLAFQAVVRGTTMRRHGL